VSEIDVPESAVDPPESETNQQGVVGRPCAPRARVQNSVEAVTQTRIRPDVLLIGARHLLENYRQVIMVPLDIVEVRR
jgi:hypothetical protein